MGCVCVCVNSHFVFCNPSAVNTTNIQNAVNWFLLICRRAFLQYIGNVGPVIISGDYIALVDGMGYIAETID